MVHQITSKNAIDLEVCSISYQRHCTSLLNKRAKITNTLCKKTVMADNTDRHPLPVVELRPFSKKVWRREKSLPDFYEKNRPEEVNTNSSSAPNSNNAPEIDPPPSRLVRELTETRKNIEIRQNTFDSALGKYQYHPKAEFLHESNRAWRKQDLIPSFITRFERTKTSLDTLSKESSFHRINFENPSMFENALKREPNPMIKIKGGKMNQQIQRRQLLYLNPLDTYRQPNSWVPHFNSTNNSRQNTSRDKFLLSSRHSLPMTSNRTRDLLLGDSQAQYPLKPIRREDAESPHKFNCKLGAAKNSLEVLSKIGIQTRLEKSLEKEMEWNMQKFRRDKLLFSNDLKGVPFQCFNVESNLTVGEMSLKTAREANKHAKGRQRLYNARRINALGGDSRGGDIFKSFTPEAGSLHRSTSSMVNPVLHPISQSLVEETDTFVGSDSTFIASHKLLGRGRDSSPPGMQHSESKDNELPSDDLLLKSTPAVVNSIANEDVSNSKDGKVDGEDAVEINNNNTAVASKEQAQVIDSSRIETNVAYLENLQLKSAQGYHESKNATPTLNLSDGEKTQPADNAGVDTHSPSNNEQLSPSGNSEYTSHRDQSLLQSQRVSPHSVADNSQTGQQPIDDQQNVDLRKQNDGQQNNSSQFQQSPKSPNTDIAQQQAQPTNQTSRDASAPNQIHPEQRRPIGDPDSSESSSRTVPDTTNPIGIASDTSLDKMHDGQADDVSTQGTRIQPVVEINNSSPLTSSGFESQPMTDQEDELSPGSDHQGAFIPGASEVQSRVDSGTDNGNSQTALSTQKTINLQNSTMEGDQPVAQSVENLGAVHEHDSQTTKLDPHSDNKDNVESVENEKETVVNDINNMDSPPQKLVNRAVQDSPEGDEGIGLVPTEAAVLDSSVTEVCSDQGVTGCADNGDSGVSTTFLTSEDSVPEAVEGVVMS